MGYALYFGSLLLAIGCPIVTFIYLILSNRPSTIVVFFISSFVWTLILAVLSGFSLIFSNSASGYYFYLVFSIILVECSRFGLFIIIRFDHYLI